MPIRSRRTNAPFAAYQEEGDPLSAARAARILAWLYINVFGDFAVAAGWLARAGELLDDAGEEGIERGWVELTHATAEPYGDGRPDGWPGHSDIGRRAGDTDLRFAALARLGETLVMTGRIEEGMLCFDESLAAACAGEVRDLYVVESVFCGMFLTCERVHDIVRAEQWLRAAGDLVRRRSVLAVGPLCRAHYGGLSPPRAAGTRPRPSWPKPPRCSKAATRPRARLSSSGSPTSGCARAASRRQPRYSRGWTRFPMPPGRWRRSTWRAARPPLRAMSSNAGWRCPRFDAVADRSFPAATAARCRPATRAARRRMRRRGRPRGCLGRDGAARGAGGATEPESRRLCRAGEGEAVHCHRVRRRQGVPT